MYLVLISAFSGVQEVCHDSCIAMGGKFDSSAAFGAVFSYALGHVVMSVVDKDVASADEWGQEEVVKLGLFEKGLVAGLPMWPF